jgi:predicted transposase YdaD
MFELSELKQNRFYQKVLAERQAENRLQDKLEAVPIMLQHGFTVEETSKILGLTLEQVLQAA